MGSQTVPVSELNEGDRVEVMYQPYEYEDELEYHVDDEIVMDSGTVVSTHGNGVVVEFDNTEWQAHTGEESQYARLRPDDPAPEILPANDADGELYMTDPLPKAVVNELVVDDSS